MILPFRFRVLLVVSIVLMLWTSWLFFKSTRHKENYPSVIGKIVYLGETYQDLPDRDQGKYRYILLDNYPAVFELFIGKDAGDFKPKYENIDNLLQGDVVRIYHEEKNYASGGSTTPVNSSVKFVDKDDMLFFEEGNSKP